MHNSIHKFKQGENLIVLDINSGGVHVVDEVIYAMLDHLSPPLSKNCPPELFGIFIETFSDLSEQDIMDYYTEVYELYIKGILFSGGDFEKYAETVIEAPVKALCLHVSHDCNLRCKYCFAETGDFGTGRVLMTPETGRAAIDFLIINSGERQNLEVDFFGGEPLMAWETVVETVKYARLIEKEHNKNFRFTITTNGILLDEDKINYINAEMSNAVLSLDGRRGTNDKMRITPNGKGSYDLIVPSFKKLVQGRTNKGRTDYYLRGTFTAYNLDFTEDILSMAEEGFTQISVESAVTSPDLPYAIKEEHLPAIMDEYDRLYEIMRKKPRKFNFFHFNIDLNQGPCVIKRLRGCGAGNEYAAIAPNGDVFPCHQFVGINEWKMGNIYSTDNKNSLNQEIKEYFSKTHIYNKEDCPQCWARFYCSGGCNAAGFLYEGDARKPHKISCEMMKKRIECAIALKV